MDEKDVTAALVHAVHTQHTAIDILAARLIVADPTFRLSQCSEVLDALQAGQGALRDWMTLRRKEKKDTE